MAKSNAPVIIKKVKKGHGHGHHGGAWKVAYADFVTAMMAFFLLLWLLNATTDEQKAGIADYFTPSSVSKSNSGGGGVMAGQTLSEQGAMQANRSAVNLTISLPSTESPEELGDYNNSSQTEQENARTNGIEQEGDFTRGTGRSEAELRAVEEAIRQEEARFDEAEQALRQAIESMPELRQLADHLLIDHTPDGLRIQIVDQDKLSMFPLGSAEMHGHTRRLMTLVVGAVGQLPNRLAIKGHTDATPFQSQNGYSNWELSTDRANASRRALLAAGLPAERIASVAGRAAEEPLLPDDPISPRNRRISIILLRDGPSAAIRPLAEDAASGALDIQVEPVD